VAVSNPSETSNVPMSRAFSVIIDRASRQIEIAAFSSQLFDRLSTLGGAAEPGMAGMRLRHD
jgi:hypothetical protein